MPRPCPFRSKKLRDQADEILRRAELLTPQDREFLRLVLDRGVPTSQLARQAGLHRSTLRRRLHKLVRRLTDEQNLALLRAHDILRPTDRKLVVLSFLRGLSTRDAARETGIPYHRARRRLDALKITADLLTHSQHHNPDPLATQPAALAQPHG